VILVSVGVDLCITLDQSAIAGNAEKLLRSVAELLSTMKRKLSEGHYDTVVTPTISAMNAYYCERHRGRGSFV
jgi:hypothetical protein